MCKVLKNALQEALGVASIILIILFCSLNTLTLQAKFPQKTSPYVKME
jgi:hypothetical protein